MKQQYNNLPCLCYERMSGWRHLNGLEEQGHERGWLSPDPLGWQQSCTQLIVDHHVHSLHRMTQKCQDKRGPWRMVAWLSYCQRWAWHHGSQPFGCSCFGWLWWLVFSNHMLMLTNMPRAHLHMFKIGTRPHSSEKVYRDVWALDNRIWCLLTSGWCGSQKGQSC